MQIQSIIVGGGVGQRMGAGLAKQFRYLGQRRVAEYTLERFMCFAPDSLIWVVIAAEYESLAQELWSKYPQVRILIGGKERFFSVKNAVAQINPQGLVFVHDMVRPCVSAQLLQRCYLSAKEYGIAIPKIKPTETIRYQGQVLSRGNVALMQTPQTFRADWLKHAFQQDFRPEFTDEAAVLEQAGYQLHFVEGERQNIKITYLEDLKLAECLCQ